jgi:hypothetical protein
MRNESIAQKKNWRKEEWDQEWQKERQEAKKLYRYPKEKRL